MNKTLVIVGAGGHGKVVADCAEATGRYNKVVFLDTHYPNKTEHLVWPVVASAKDAHLFVAVDTEFFVAIGDNQARHRVMDELKSVGGHISTLIHPAATVSPHVSVGQGTLICAAATINPAVTIGMGCIINTSASIDHDCTIDAYTHVAPGCRLAGTVTLGKHCFIGIGTAIVPNVTVGDATIVGAGSTVIKDIPANVTAVGTPAKILTDNN